MPSKSKAQEKFFNIAAHDPDFAKEHGIKPSTAKEWHEADKARHNGKTSVSSHKPVSKHKGSNHF